MRCPFLKDREVKYVVVSLYGIGREKKGVDLGNDIEGIHNVV